MSSWEHFFKFLLYWIQRFYFLTDWQYDTTCHRNIKKQHYLFGRTSATLHREWIHTFVNSVFARWWLGHRLLLNCTPHKSFQLFNLYIEFRRGLSSAFSKVLQAATPAEKSLWTWLRMALCHLWSTRCSTKATLLMREQPEQRFYRELDFSALEEESKAAWQEVRYRSFRTFPHLGHGLGQA